ncbi:MAG: hypothetical protein R2568_06935 [Candidatus Scalindua sp.]|jgi:hypothetical protein|nr:hypothetical protein [Candidatus Scalindua sp.]MDV5166469.1 hypothetical protein [Candidatus Scalindua sp.]
MSLVDYSSEKNQTIKERFVDREVFGNISSLMERIIKCEKKEVSIEKDILGSMATLMEDIIKSGRKDGSAEKEVLERTGALMESIKGDKNCELYNEIENLYKYRIDIPEVKRLKVHEKVKLARGDVLETERERIVKEIREKIAELKGEESFSDMILADGEISEETNKINQADIDERIAELERCSPGIENARGEMQEICEWIHVSNFLHDRLREKGHPVWNDDKVYMWGRTTAGQAVFYDDVITEICNDMEIFEGQKNEWKM